MDKAQLLAPRRPEADVEIPGVGTVRARGLTRGEVNVINSRRERDGNEAFECCVIAYGMADPRLTEDEAKQWYDNSAFGELQPVIEAILRLSGLMPESDKEAYKSLPGGPGDGDGVLPGEQAGDDGGPAPDGDDQ